MLRATNTEIQLNRIAHNIAEIKTRLRPETKYLAVVKANAYGHGIEEVARFVQRNGADYLGVGAVFPSPTKPDALRITPAMLKTIASSVSIPCVAIGGITRDNVGELSGCGIRGAAVVNAVFGQSDVKHAAAVMKARVKETLNNG